MKSIFTYFLLLTCCRANGLFSGERKEVLTFRDKINEKVNAAAAVLEAEYANIDKLKAESEELESFIKEKTQSLTLLNLKAKSQELEGSIKERTVTLTHLNEKVEQSRGELNSLDLHKKELLEENEKLENTKNMLKMERRKEESKLNQTLQEIKDKEHLKVKLVDDIEILKEDETKLKSTIKNLNNEKSKETETYKKLIEEKENVEKEKQTLDSTIFSLSQEQTQLQNEKATKEQDINGLDEQINHKNGVIIELNFKVTKVQEDLENYNQQRDELKKGNKKMLKDMCNEHYAFWNLDFLSNNIISTSYYGALKE